MSQGGGRKHTKLSKLQRILILWFGGAMGKIPELKPFTNGEELAFLANLREEAEQALQDLMVIKEAADAGAHDEAEVYGLMSRVWTTTRGVPWNLARVLGRSPTPSESVIFSNSLARLEKRGLIRRTRNRGKRKHTSHVRLTEEGAEVLNSLICKERQPGGILQRIAEKYEQ